MNDAINHPPHYTSHPSGVECVDIIEHMPFNVGSAMKYLWRCDLKHPDALEDLKKARWYVEREIAKREKEQSSKAPDPPAKMVASYDRRTRDYLFALLPEDPIIEEPSCGGEGSG